MSSDLQIVVNLKGVFMGKLKEKLKPEKLSATFPAYIIAYFMCMMTGFCMIMFFRELMYQIGILKRYGLGEIGNVASALLFVLVCAFFFYHGAKIIICRAHKKSKKELKHPNGLMACQLNAAQLFILQQK